MENNSNYQNYQNYQKEEKINNFSLEKSIYQPQIIIPILETSLKNQRIFIEFILYYFNGFPKIKSINIFKQILNILPFIIKQLGLPFSSLLIEENDLLQLLLEIYSSYKEFSNQISSIFQNIYYLFERIENELISCPIDDWKEILYELEIINDDENNNYKGNNYLTNVEIMFVKLNNLFDNWIQYRNMGNNIEEENLYIFDECLNLYQQELFELNKDENISNADLEYFEEMFNKIKEFRNEKFLNDYKYIDNDLSLDDINNDNFNQNYINSNNIINDNIKNRSQEIKEILANLRKIPLNKRTFFYKNERILEDEDEFTEFKNYYFPFGDKQILELKRQICGFINSNGGRIYIGITDQKLIKGIVLNDASLICFQNIIFSSIDNFNPHIEDGKIKIYYIPIKNIQNDSYINNLYIIKIAIYPGNPTILYSISQNLLISSIRLQGQCANLTAEEIHKEIIERYKNKKIKKIKFNEEDFNDPEPELIDEDEQCEQNNEYYDDLNYQNNYLKEKRRQLYYRNNRNKKGKKYKKNYGKNVTIKISNIDDEIYINDLKNIFKNCGCYSGQFFGKRNGKSNGVGYLHFANEKLANNCIMNFNNKILGRKLLKLKKK